MLHYIVYRLLLVIPTLFGIIALNFIIVQFAPGGPVEKILAVIEGHNNSVAERVGGATNDGASSQSTTTTHTNNDKASLDDAIRRDLEKLYGFDKPPLERFTLMLWNYMRLDFGTSYISGRPVINMIYDALPVSISLGVWSTLLIYIIAIPLGIRKAVSNGSKFDVISSFIMIILYAIPSFLLAVLLLVLLAGGRFIDIFPIRGLSSLNAGEWPLYKQIADYIWHLILPITAMAVGGMASLMLLTKNSFLDELSKHYVLTARAKGISEQAVFYGHVFRNAMLIIIAGFPASFISMFFTGALLIEIIFSLNGLGLLGFEAVVNRDYAVFFATLYMFTLLGLLLNIISDIMYSIIDPRIHFGKISG